MENEISLLPKPCGCVEATHERWGKWVEDYCSMHNPENDRAFCEGLLSEADYYDTIARGEE